MTRYPGAVWRPVPSHGGPMTAQLGLVLHVQQGNGGLRAEFADPARQKSSTWWAGKLGQVEQYVDADLRAWAQGAGNATYCSVETEGFDSEPLTENQLGGLAYLYAWGHQHYGWPLQLAERPGEPGLGWHGMGGDAWGGHPFCPGVIRRGQRADVIDRAVRYLAAITDERTDDVKDYLVSWRGAQWVVARDLGHKTGLHASGDVSALNKTGQYLVVQLSDATMAGVPEAK